MRARRVVQQASRQARPRVNSWIKRLQPRAVKRFETQSPAGRQRCTVCAIVASMASPSSQRNLLGLPLESCSTGPVTGFFRTGCCETDESDVGCHVVCAQMTEEFLAFSASRGNDLSTPRGGFPGLRPGDRWCLCAARWKEALDAQVAPPVILAATHESATEIVDREALFGHALDPQSLN